MIIGTMLVRNEADRWLTQVLEQINGVCDRLIVLDDASTDATPEICEKYRASVFRCRRSLWGVDEAKRRKALWSLAKPDHGDWILCLDADETVPQINLLPGLIQLAEHLGIDGLAFSLYDMWSPTHYRDDEYWTAHNRDWVMCVRYDQDRDYKWLAGLHCGRFPVNSCTQIGRTGLKLQHWGWSRAEDREIKYKRYKQADPNGLHLAQYESILDPNPNLKEFL